MIVADCTIYFNNGSELILNLNEEQKKDLMDQLCYYDSPSSTSFIFLSGFFATKSSIKGITWIDKR